MLFTESQLRINIDPLAILDEATYLTEQEAIIRPQMVPVMEASNLGAYRIPFYALESLAESHGYSLLDAISEVCIADQIDPAYVVIEMAEEEAILYPEVVQELGSVVIAPISEYDPIYQLCESVIEQYMETLDDSILEEFNVNSKMTDNEIIAALTQYGDERLASMNKKLMSVTSSSERDSILKDVEEKLAAANAAAKEVMQRKFNKDQAQRSNQSADTPTSNSAGVGSRSDASAGNSGSSSGSSGSSTSSPSSGMGLGTKAGIGASIAAAIGGGLLAYRHYRDKPKSFIAKKIASLRSIYQKWMNKAASCKDSGIAAKLRRGAAKILQVIDKLMAFLQRKADGK